MGSTSIEWTEATAIVDRGGRRVRYYTRKRPGPPKKTRREMAANGLRWCRVCQEWRPDADVRGLCREHARAAYRAHYAANREAMCAAKVARKRGIEPVPPIGMEYLTEKFRGRCAYCPAPATTWDHIVPVSAGGTTEPGNIVPCCLSCNSSKKHRPLEEWLGDRLAGVAVELLDVITLAFQPLGCPPEALRG